MYSRLVAAWRDNANRLTARDRAVDAAIALLVFGAAVGLLFSNGLGPPPADTRDGDALGVALLVLACLPLVFRRVAPSLVLVLTTAPVRALHPAALPGRVQQPAADRGLHAGRRRRSRPGLRLGGEGARGGSPSSRSRPRSSIVDDGGFPGPELAAVGVLWLAFWIAGDRTRLRRERIAELESVRCGGYEREAERERRLAAAEERTKIARELHDSAGHAMNVILVEAGAARLLRDRDPPTGRGPPCETIEQVARSDDRARSTASCVSLREHGADGRSRQVRRCPGCEDIETLAERQRTAGRPVTTRVEGETPSLSRPMSSAPRTGSSRRR